MYLHYYLNEKYVGTVDIEVMMVSKNRSMLITNDPDGAALIESLELMYGKHIERFSSGEAYDLRRGMPTKGTKHTRPWPAHVYLTKKAGPVLAWSEHSRSLL